MINKRVLFFHLLIICFSLLYANTDSDSYIISEKKFQLSGFTIEGYSSDDQVMVAVAPFDFTGTSLKEQELETITALFSSALVNSYSFGVLDRDYLNSVIKEQAFQLSGLTDQITAVKIGQILGVQGFFLGTLKEKENGYQLYIRFIDIESIDIKSSNTVYEFTTGIFALNEIDTYMEWLVLHITTDMGIRIPEPDFNTALIIAVEDDLNTALINVGSKNIDPGEGMGVQERFIYVLYKNNKEVTRGLVTEVSIYSSKIGFKKRLPADILSNPAYKLVLFGYFPNHSFRFWGPFAGNASGDVGFDTGFGIQYMSNFNVALDLYLGIGTPYAQEIEVEGDEEDGATVYTPIGFSYHFRNLNTFTIGLGIGLGIINYHYSSEIETKIVPSFYSIIIPNGRRTFPGARTSALQFTPIIRIIPMTSSLYWALGLGVTW